MLIGPLGTHFSEIIIGIHKFSFKRKHLKISSANWRPFCLGFNVATIAVHFIIPLGIICHRGYHWTTVYPKKYAHGFCFAVLCCGYTLTDFPISIRLTSLALWQSNDCPSASKATLMNMDKYFTWNQYKRLHNHNKAKHNKTVCIFLGIYCRSVNWLMWTFIVLNNHYEAMVVSCNWLLLWSGLREIPTCTLYNSPLWSKEIHC